MLRDVFGTILLVDDFEPWRRRASSILQGHPYLKVVGEASKGAEAICLANELKPALILLDLGLPDMTGVEVANRLHQVVPAAKILIVTSNSDTEIVQELVSNVAPGYVLKTDAGTELLPAVESVLQGKSFVSSGIKNFVRTD